MRLLLDENVPRKLAKDLEGHIVYTVRELRFNGNEDEDILRLLLEFNIDALITCDKNLRFQQNLNKYSVPILVLDTYTNAYPVLKSVIPALLNALQQPLDEGATLIKTPDS